MKGVAGEIIAGRYQVTALVGTGGFGTVFAGRQLNLERDVAIKVMRTGPEGSAVSRERFRREAVLSAGFSHPNIVTYHDFLIDDDGDMILVMELLRGVTLDRVLGKQAHLDVPRAVRMVADVAAGLAECHRAGIVHRDIKPSNIFILEQDTPRERAKIIDFGILWTMPEFGTEMPGLTRENAFIGTPEYVAPEVLVGAYPDGRTDQYALALVALRAMTGLVPFPDSRGKAILDRLSARPPALGSSALARFPAVKGALFKALSPEPGDRFGDLDAFGRAMAAGVEQHSAEGVSGDGSSAIFGSRTGGDATLVEMREGLLDSFSGRFPVPEGYRSATAAPEGRRGRGRRGLISAVVGISGVVLVAALAVAVGPSLIGRWNPRPADQELTPVARTEGLEPISSLSRPVVEPAVAEPSVAEPSVPVEPAAVAVAPVAVPVAQPRPAKAGISRKPVANPAKQSVVPSDVSDQRTSDQAAPATGTGTGRVIINADPWAHVWLDGRHLGTTGNLPVQTVSAGRHTLVFKNEYYEVMTREFVIRADEERKESVKLVPKSNVTSGRP